MLVFSEFTVSIVLKTTHFLSPELLRWYLGGNYYSPNLATSTPQGLYLRFSVIIQIGINDVQIPRSINKVFV